MWITASICTDWQEILYWRAVTWPKWRHQPAVSTHISFQGESRMARSNGGKAKAFFRTTPSGAFDQYLQDIQKLPLIKDPAEERRLARRVQRGDEKAAERLVTANLRSRPGRQIHSVRRVVGAASGAEGVGGTDAQRSNSAQPELTV